MLDVLIIKIGDVCNSLIRTATYGHMPVFIFVTECHQGVGIAIEVEVEVEVEDERFDLIQAWVKEIMTTTRISSIVNV